MLWYVTLCLLFISSVPVYQSILPNIRDDLKNIFVIMLKFSDKVGPGSSVGIETGYGLDGPGIESRWVRDFPHLSRMSLGPPSLLYNGYRVFPGGKKRPGRDADPSPLIVPWSWKGRAILLLPLWAVRHVQSLSVCTRVNFTFYFTDKTITKRAVTCFAIITLEAGVPQYSG